jgi:hypothetical protein
MKDIKERRSNTHQCSIKDVDVYFGRLERPICARDILDNAEDRSDHDKAARHVEDEDESLPRSRDRYAFPGRVFVDAAVEDVEDGDEECEEVELNCEAENDNVLASLLICGGFGLG